MKLEAFLAQRSRGRLIRLSCYLSLIGLALMVVSVLWPRPLTVIVAMSIGPFFGVAALVGYALSIVLDSMRRGAASSLPPSGPRSAPGR